MLRGRPPAPAALLGIALLMVGVAWALRARPVCPAGAVSAGPA